MIDITNNKLIKLGIKGENLARTLEIDFSAWQEEYGAGTVTLYVLRPTESLAYAATITQSSDYKVSFPITSKETAIAGYGKLELKYVVGTKVVKSITMKTSVEDALGTTTTVPGPYQDVLDAIDDKIEEAEETVEAVTELEVASTTLAAGSSATVVKSETSEGHMLFTFGIPQGNKGDKGDTGNPGSDGEDGDPGTTYTPTVSSEGVISWTNDGGKVNPPAVSIKGPQGEQGLQGVQGIQGLQGPTGEAFSIYKTYASIAEMEADASNVPTGKFVIIASDIETTDNARLYVKNAQGTFTFIVDMSGATGIQGPQGQQGIQGPQGNPGSTGSQGPAGSDGTDGTTFTPTVSAAGVISWTNDGGKQNPTSVDLVTAVINALPVAEGSDY